MDINWAQLSQLVSQGSLTISQLTTVLTAMGIRQDLIRLIISGGNVNMGLLQQVFAQYHVTASQVQIAMTEAGVNPVLIGMIVHSKVPESTDFFPRPSFEYPIPSYPGPGSHNGNGMIIFSISMSVIDTNSFVPDAIKYINWDQLSQLLSQGSVTISQLTAALNAVGINQDVINVIIRNNSINFELLQHFLTQYHVTMSQLEVALIRAGINPSYVFPIFHSGPSVIYPNPSIPPQQDGKANSFFHD